MKKSSIVAIIVAIILSVVMAVSVAAYQQNGILYYDNGLKTATCAIRGTLTGQYIEAYTSTNHAGDTLFVSLMGEYFYPLTGVYANAIPTSKRDNDTFVAINIEKPTSQPAVWNYAESTHSANNCYPLRGHIGFGD